MKVLFIALVKNDSLESVAKDLIIDRNKSIKDLCKDMIENQRKAFYFDVGNNFTPENLKEMFAAAERITKGLKTNPVDIIHSNTARENADFIIDNIIECQKVDVLSMCKDAIINASNKGDRKCELEFTYESSIYATTFVYIRDTLKELGYVVDYTTSAYNLLNNRQIMMGLRIKWEGPIK